MQRQEFIDRFLLPTDSQNELPNLSSDQIRQFMRAFKDLGVRVVFVGELIDEQRTIRMEGKLSAANLARGLGIEQGHLSNPNTYAGPYLVESEQSAVRQASGIMLYAVKNENDGA